MLDLLRWAFATAEPVRAGGHDALLGVREFPGDPASRRVVLAWLGGAGHRARHLRLPKVPVHPGQDGGMRTAPPSSRRAGGVARVPAPALVLAGVVSTQVGAAAGKTLFPELGLKGSAALRVLGAASVLLDAVCPRPGVRTRTDLA